MFTRNYYFFSDVERCMQRARDYAHKSKSQANISSYWSVDVASALA